METQSGANIVIVGGGFAGVARATLLANDARMQVTLIDQNGYQQLVKADAVAAESAPKPPGST